MSTRFGTANFVSLNSAIRYYMAQEGETNYTAMLPYIREKIRKGEIRLGRPIIGENEKLFTDENGRYHIERE